MKVITLESIQKRIKEYKDKYPARNPDPFINGKVTMLQELEKELIQDMQMTEAMDQYFDYMEEVRKHNEPLFQKLSDKYGEDAFMELFEDCSFSNKIEVVTNVSFREPTYKAGDEYPCDVYVDQWTVGTEGDSWEGFKRE